MSIKDERQKEFVDKFLTLKNRRGTIIAATGMGKSKIALDILEAVHKDYDEIMIVVNADRLRDVTWKQEFLIWKKHDLFKKVNLRNYQTVYKWNPSEVPLEKTFIVYDEIDFAIGTPEYSKVFENYKNHPSLGLTGYCAQAKRESLEKTLPVIVEYPFEQAVEDGVINNIRFHFLKFDLDKNPKGIKVSYKKNGEDKHFYQSENDAYDYADKKFRILQGEYEQALFDLSMGSITQKTFQRVEMSWKMARNNRLKLLYNSIASANYAIKLQEAILNKSPDNKVIVFSKYTEQAEKINKNTYHSKNAPNKNDKMMHDFNEGNIRCLSVCSKIDRGDNIKGLNNLILESYTSSDTVIRQRAGRGSRLDPVETANIYILLPYFMRKGKDGSYSQASTQAVKWATAMLSGYDLSKAKVYDYRSIKSDL